MARAALKPDPEPDEAAILREPSFLLRRAHQIAVSIFLAQTADLRVTGAQYALMSALQARPGVDQALLARLTGLDRATTGLVSETLERLGLIERRAAADDRRRKALMLTDAGRARMQALAAPAARATAQMLEPFTEGEGAQFLALLTRFALAHNAAARAPLGIG